MIFLSVCLSSLFVRSFARSSSVYLDIGRGIYHSAVPARRGTVRLSIARARASQNMCVLVCRRRRVVAKSQGEKRACDRPRATLLPSTAIHKHRATRLTHISIAYKYCGSRCARARARRLRTSGPSTPRRPSGERADPRSSGARLPLL